MITRVLSVRVQFLPSYCYSDAVTRTYPYGHTVFLSGHRQ